MRMVRIRKSRGRIALTASLLLALLLAMPTAAFAAAPSNDDVATPRDITQVPFSETIDTTDASSDPTDPQVCLNDKSVWYRFTSAEARRVIVDTSGSDYDTLLAVFRNQPSKDTLLACNDDWRSVQSRVGFEAKAGITYWFMVTGQGGVLTLNVTPPVPPKNDELSSAKNVSLRLPYEDVMDTTEATLNVNDPDCSGRARSVWYKYSRPRDWTEKRLELTTARSNYDTTLSVYTGRRGNLSQVECVDDSGGSTSRLRFMAEPGKTYFIMVGASSNSPGGRLVFKAKEAPVPFHMRLGIDGKGRISEVTGSTKITGTLRCTHRTSVYVSVHLRQKIGDQVRSASERRQVGCSGKKNWGVTIHTSRPFKRGVAGLWVEASAPRKDREKQKNRVVTLETCARCL